MKKYREKKFIKMLILFLWSIFSCTNPTDHLSKEQKKDIENSNDVEGTGETGILENNSNTEFYEVEFELLDYENNELTSIWKRESYDYKKTTEGFIENKIKETVTSPTGNQISYLNEATRKVKNNTELYQGKQIYYKYDSNQQKIDRTIITTQTCIIDPEIHCVIKDQINAKIINKDGEIENYDSNYNGEKKFLRTEEGVKVYKYTQDNLPDGSYTLIYVDEDGCIIKIELYKNTGNIERTEYYSHLPECPDSLKTYYWEEKKRSEDLTVYDYYNERIDILLNTSDEYKYEITREYKYKHNSSVMCDKEIYTYKAFLF